MWERAADRGQDHRGPSLSEPGYPSMLFLKQSGVPAPVVALALGKPNLLQFWTLPRNFHRSEEAKAQAGWTQPSPQQPVLSVLPDATFSLQICE